MRSRPRLPLTALAVALLAVLTWTTGCSDDDAGDDDGASAPDAGSPTPDSGSPEPEGPAAKVAGELEGGNGVFLAAGMAADLPTGWTEAEFAVEGTAVSYAADGPLPGDGNYALHEGGTAEYRTRIVVRRPPAADFNGAVVVEWLNVSGGLDANPDWAYLVEELTRSGYAWVGVSAQHIGVEGGPVLVSLPISEGSGAGMGLKALDPERYGELNHPGDAFAYDIFTQVGRLVRSGESDGVLGELEPARVLAVGESQSAFMLTTYYNGVQPLTLAFDGFFVHSRGGGGAPLGMPGKGIDLVSAISAPDVKLRTDLDAPVFVLETETDMLFILDYFPARQPNSASVHSWEVAGTAHADEHLLGPIADQVGCDVPLNAGPQHFVAKAALHHLDAWVRSGEAPPAAEVLEIDSAATPIGYVLDANGNALGGVRTPQVDVPVDILSGAPAGSSIACMLFGSTTPLSDARLAELYDSPAAYMDAYTAAADAAIAGGFVLEADREALLDDADATRIAP
jgi:hypothetical protein